MAVLMQTCGRSFAALLENVVAQQKQLTVAGQTCAAQDRLNVYGVDPMVLTKAANQLAAEKLAGITTSLLELLRDTGSLAGHPADDQLLTRQLNTSSSPKAAMTPVQS